MTPKNDIFDTLKSEVSKSTPENNREGPKNGQNRGVKNDQKWVKNGVKKRPLLGTKNEKKMAFFDKKMAFSMNPE